MKYFDEEFLEIQFDSQVGCVVMIWKKFARSADYRRGLDEGLNLVKKMNTKKWLADLRNMQVISVEDQEWSNKDWFSRALQAGIRKMAIVQPSSELTKMGVKNIMNKIGDIELETNYFGNIENAKKWLATF